MEEEHAYQRLKWTVLDEAPAHHNSSIAYYWAKRAFPDRSAEELDPVVQQVLLELLDEGWIYFYWGGWDDGGDPHASERPTRAEVEADLARGGDAPPTARTVWFTATDAGKAKLDSIPAETLLGYEEQQEMREFEERHPEYAQKLSEWLEAEQRWVDEGGRRPKPPWFDYEDYPRPTERWRWVDSLPGSRLGNLLGSIYLFGARLKRKAARSRV
jgi:hypothetical protein